MILLDTNVLISGSFPPVGEMGASILSRAELEFGIRAARDGATAAARTRRLANLDRVLEWAPLDRAASRAYGLLAAEIHRRAPAKARRTDTFIAAQAYALGVPLMTANTEDFELMAHMVDIIDARGRR
ncbi:MAG: hypothetical protein LBT54_06950 [Bifidobacteriaceae bacterium]|nr:hypothetical protein [Bifidobacteriaceae bacterium]